MITKKEARLYPKYFERKDPYVDLYRVTRKGARPEFLTGGSQWDSSSLGSERLLVPPEFKPINIARVAVLKKREHNL